MLLLDFMMYLDRYVQMKQKQQEERKQQLKNEQDGYR